MYAFAEVRQVRCTIHQSIWIVRLNINVSLERDDALQAARELARYFSDPRCTLAKFVLSKADVDDFEVGQRSKRARPSIPIR